MILSPNLEINNHPDPSADTSIDNPTKKKLGVLFAENNGEVLFHNIPCRIVISIQILESRLDIDTISFAANSF